MADKTKVLALIKSRPATIPDGFSDIAISSYIDEALQTLLSYCNMLPPDPTSVPDALLYAWTSIATASMQADSVSQTGVVGEIKDGAETITFAQKKPSQAQLMDSLSITNIKVMNRYHTMF